MKSFFIPIFLFALSICSAQNSNTLKFDSNIKDYGTLNYGEHAQCNFELTNIGKEDIQIKNVKSNSRSLEFKLSDSLLKPGETTKLSVIYDTEKEGPIRKTITVFSDAKPSVYTLTVKGRVLPKS